MESYPQLTLFDLNQETLRDLNLQLHNLTDEDAKNSWKITNPKGKHAIACGLKVPVSVEIDGHAGYYCAGMNQLAEVTINGNVGVGVAENMMTGLVRVKGNASQSAGATGRGGLLVIEGDASARCGISMKGIDIVVHGSIGHMSAFMGQAGRLVVNGDAGEALGDSLYEAHIYVRGKVRSLGADCIEKPMRDGHINDLETLIEASRLDAKASDFRRYGSARKLYNFNIDNASQY
jgi:methylamine---glutamate N-methyltransferase subunit B